MTEADNYERLSGLDNSFLVFETRNTPMHVAAVVIFEAGPLMRPQGRPDMDRVRAYVASRLHDLPRYRQRLAYVPIEQRPVWIDDERFDLGYHVRHSSLPRPGDDRQLRDLCARILERQLDRDRPLWETWFIEGLQDNRFAMLTKAHHCMVDGIAGVDLLAALMRPSPDDTIEPPQSWTPRPAPSPRQLFWHELSRRARSVRRLVSAAALPRLDIQPADLRERAAALWDLASVGLRPAAATPINRPVGAHRRVHWLASQLAEVKAIKNRLGGTVNDVVLATVAGAVRRFLEHRRVCVDQLDFRAVVPVSTRSDADSHALGNRVSAWITALPIGERDPATRLAHVQRTTTQLKESKQRLGVELLTQVVEWTSFSFLASTVRLASHTRSFNLVVTNVPGPRFPLFLLGAPMVAAYPHVPLFEGQGLGVALFSYTDTLYWGLNADWDLVPDLDHFVNAIAASFDELRRAAGPIRVAAAPEKTRAARRSRAGSPRRRIAAMA